MPVFCLCFARPCMAFSSHSATPQFAHRAGSPSAVCSLVVCSASAHADITLPATTELGAVSRRRIGGGHGGSPPVIAQLPYMH